jgi:hypothetical protein
VFTVLVELVILGVVPEVVIPEDQQLEGDAHLSIVVSVTMFVIF